MALHVNSFNYLLTFMQAHGYFFIFLLMVFEGPIVTTSAAFAASLGYLNIFIVAILAFLGDVVGDLALYFFGFFGRNKFLGGYGNFFGVNAEFLSKLEKHFEKHLGKTLFIIKMTPLAVPGLMLAGVSRVPIKKYMKWNILITIPEVIFFTGLGYFFGFVANSFLKLYKNVTLYFVALVIIIVVLYWASKKISEKIVKPESILK